MQFENCIRKSVCPNGTKESLLRTVFEKWLFVWWRGKEQYNNSSKIKTICSIKKHLEVMESQIINVVVQDIAEFAKKITPVEEAGETLLYKLSFCFTCIPYIN